MTLQKETTSVKIGIAKSKEEKEEIYRLRYQIYAEEIHYKLSVVDHINKLLYDDLDEWGILFYAQIDSKFVGTSRINIGKIEKFTPEVIETFYMNRFKKFYNENEDYNFGLATKFMTLSSYRSSSIFTSLLLASYEVYYHNHVLFGFANTNFHLLPLHEFCGHRRIGKNTVDRDYGVLAGYVMLTEDIEYLQKVTSPLLQITEKLGIAHNDRLAKWFTSEFHEATTIVNSRLVKEAELWKSIYNFLQNSPLESMPILKGLSEAEAKKFLHSCCVIVQCKKNEYILTKDDACQELHVLLSGQLFSMDLPTINNVIPGQHFGENGLVERTRHTFSILAKTDTEILVLSYNRFLKFRQLNPEISQKILFNL